MFCAGSSAAELDMWLRGLDPLFLFPPYSLGSFPSVLPLHSSHHVSLSLFLFNSSLSLFHSLGPSPSCQFHFRLALLCNVALPPFPVASPPFAHQYPRSCAFWRRLSIHIHLPSHLQALTSSRRHFNFPLLGGTDGSREPCPSSSTFHCRLASSVEAAPWTAPLFHPPPLHLLWT